MAAPLKKFERIARNAFRFAEAQRAPSEHPFELRDIHPALPADVRRLFDNSHYAQATFEALKYLDSEVRRLSRVSKTGKALMMDALRESNPPIQLTPLSTDSERDEQEGYRFLFAGAIVGIRNPRGHEHSLQDELGTCLDHLTLVSHLLRRLEKAGFKLKPG